MRYVIIGEVASDTKRERWRGFTAYPETLFGLAKRACGDEYRYFTIIKAFTEEEYTKEKGNEAWAKFKSLPW